MLWVPADLPDALIGVVLVLDRRFDERAQPLPYLFHDLRRAPGEVGVDRVEEHPPDVVLVLVPCTVAHADGPGVSPSGQVVEGPLGEVTALRRSRT